MNHPQFTFQLKDERTHPRLKKKWKSSPSEEQGHKRAKPRLNKNGKAHRLLSKGTRRGIELRFRPHEPSKEKKLQQKDQNEVNQKKSLTFSSPGTCLHKSSHQFHSEAHTGDSSLDFLVFFITKK